MKIRSYFPSGQFAAILASLAMSGGIVWAADHIVHPSPSIGSLVATNESAQIPNTDWTSQFAGSDAFEQSQQIAATAQTLTEAAKTNNLTDSIGRSLLINTAAAQGQGTIESADTQNGIINTILSQLDSATIKTETYAADDIATVTDNPDASRTYGNGLVIAIQDHPKASYNSAMIAVSLAVDSNTSSSLESLPAVAKEYRALAKEIINLKTPVSSQNTTLQIANNYGAMAGAIENMQQIISDPARGLSGIQQFQTLNESTGQLFTQLAQNFQKNRISFNETDPGGAWSLYLNAIQKEPELAKQQMGTQSQN